MKPIAQLLREKAKQKQTKALSAKENAEAERLKSIAELEKKIHELEKNSDGSSEEDSESSDDESTSDSEKEEDGLLYERDQNGNIVRIISTLVKDAPIQPLPASLLPAKRCKFATNSSDTSNKRRKISFGDDRSQQPNDKSGTASRHGFLRTVKDVIDSYVPASHEKKPFYCRICVFQGQNIEEFEAHRNSDAHKEATSKESKILFCKLCRKKFTSPAQLSEHLQGKAHKERLDQVKSAAQSRKNFC
jgi:hypothetical protein